MTASAKKEFPNAFRTERGRPSHEPLDEVEQEEEAPPQPEE